MIFPILSTIFAIIALVAIWVPTAVLTGLFRPKPSNRAIRLHRRRVATIYVSTFIAIFFNVALAACAVRSLRGEDTNVGEGITAAMRRSDRSSAGLSSRAPSG